MGRETDIQWCDSTVNPTMGCDGCELWNPKVKICYAGQITTRYGGKSSGYPPNFETVQMFPGRMAQAARWKDLRGQPRPDKPWIPKEMPRLIFISDMSDALSKAVPFEYLRDEIIFRVGDVDFPHIGMWLTKQPKRMAEFSDWLSVRDIAWPDNLWVGTSITSQATLWRINALLNVGMLSTTRFLSVEPMWERIDLNPVTLNWGIHMVIFGGESGRYPKLCATDWIRDGIKQCRSASAKPFVKQIGRNPEWSAKDMAEHWYERLSDSHGGDWSEWPEDLRIREFPSVETLKP